jgi:light-regulated signal transduction histidine kinase (bacteriophytochrome)
VTDQRRADDAVRRLNAELERRVTERTAQLEAANQELEAFSYSVAHDLRAPLRGIEGFSQIVIEEHAASLGAEGLAHLQRVRDAARRMTRLVDDLLRLGRVARIELHHERVDLSALAASVADELRRSEPGRPVDVRIEPWLVAHGDPRLLRVALDNLLGNAWKFTARSASAKIELGASDAGPDRAFFVRDNGAGFDTRAAPKLFGAFQRYHTSLEFEGTGVGLAIVQRIIDRHGGRIWADSAVDQGATFFFTLAP